MNKVIAIALAATSLVAFPASANAQGRHQHGDRSYNNGNRQGGYAYRGYAPSYGYRASGYRNYYPSYGYSYGSYGYPGYSYSGYGGYGGYGSYGYPGYSYGGYGYPAYGYNYGYRPSYYGGYGMAATATSAAIPRPAPRSAASPER